MSALIPAIIKLIMSRSRGGGGGSGGSSADPYEKHQKIWQGKILGTMDDKVVPPAPISPPFSGGSKKS